MCKQALKLNTQSFIIIYNQFYPKMNKYQFKITR